jgi:hypothetical protein
MAHPYRNTKSSPLNQNGDKKKKPTAFQNYIDLDGDGKDEWWEYGIEAATWAPTIAAAVIGTAASPAGTLAAGTATKVATKAGAKNLVKLVQKKGPKIVKKVSDWAHKKGNFGLPNWVRWPAKTNAAQQVFKGINRTGENRDKRLNLDNNRETNNPLDY